VSLDGATGNVTAAAETAVTFGHPGIEQVALDGEVASLSGRDRDYVEVVVPPGSHELELLTG
jgi:hypothetical protein